MRWVTLLVLSITACSLANREGPDVSCADLMNGAVNACAEGIIATCTAGAVTWKVCESESACGSSWQVEGAYRCSQSDPAPDLGDGSPGPGDGDDGGDGDGDDGDGDDSDGQDEDGGTDSPGGDPSCGAGDTCQLAELPAGSGEFCALTENGENLYALTNAGEVWSVPKAGGLLKKLAEAMNPPTNCGLAVVGSDVYFTGAGTIESVPVAGGTPTILARNYLAGLVADESHVYWGTIARAVDRLAIDGGQIESFIEDDFHGLFLRANADALYWTDPDGREINVLAKATPGSIAVLTLGSARASRIEVDEVNAYIIDTASQGVARVDLTSGQVASLAVVETAEALGLSEASVYVSFPGGIDRVAKTGGALNRIATIGASIIEVDDSHVFFADRGKTKLYRASR